MFKLIAKIIYSVLLFIETILAIRFVLTIIEADSTFELVKLVYDVSNFFLTPIIGLVPSVIYFLGFAIDSLALVGLIIYMILAFVTIELIKTFS